MNFRLLIHNALCLCAAALLGACVMDDDPSGYPKQAAPVEVNLGITLTRAVKEGTSVGDVTSTPDDMQVWMFDQQGTLQHYEVIPTPAFAGSDALGELVNTTRRTLDLPLSVISLRIYVVLNSGNATGLTLGPGTTEEALQEATFSGLATGLTDNEVPIYGTGTLELGSPRQKQYEVSISTTRAVGKLQLLFTKDSPSAYLEIESVHLMNLPSTGWLVPSDKPRIPSINQRDMPRLNSSPVVIGTYLSPDQAQEGEFSRHESSFTSLTLTRPYLLENPYGGLWTELDGNDDYTYPDQPDDVNRRYLLTVSYRTAPDGEVRTQSIYLPKIVRNEWNKIYARVMSDGYELQLQVLPWELEEVNVDFTDELSYTSGGWDDETIIQRTGNTVQLNPSEEYAVLRFIINSPSAATWHASITGTDMGAFELVEGYSSGAAYADGDGQLEPVEQEIRVRLTDPNSTERHEATLHVYADIGGVTYELDLTGDERQEPGDPDDPINRFTLLQTY